MAVFTFILLIVILIMVIITKNDLTGKIEEMNHKLDLLIKHRERVAPTTNEEKTASPDYNRQPTLKPEPAPHIPPVVPPVIPEAPTPPVIEVVTPPQPAPIIPEPVSELPQPAREAAFTAAVAVPIAAQESARPKEPTPTFWEKNPDLEKFIGENLFNKIGIAILVIGIGFFLKYAIDKNWINEIGRTFIGIVAGGILIGLAHRLRKTFTAFSSVLVGGGVAVLYFSITIAFQQYHLIGQTLAFIMMVLITAFTVVLSLSYDRKELAVLAILGGFSAPLLISTGAGNAAVLFTYILILNIGMLILAYFKKWNIVNIISYIATVILFGSWLSFSIQQEATRPVPYVTALVFATLFYIVFFLMNVINNLRQRVSFQAGEILILLSNTFLYYAAGMIILSHIHAGIFQGLFTACMAVFNFAFAYSLYRNQHADRNLIYLLIGLTLSFLSLAAPVQLKGHHITLFWAAESVLLLWLYQRSGIKLMQYASGLVFFMMSVSLMVDWQQTYENLRYAGSGHMPPLLNQGFVTGIVCIAALFIIRRLLKNDLGKQYFIEIPVSMLRKALGLFALAVIYIVGILELNYQSGIYWLSVAFINDGIYNYIFICILLYLSRKEHVIFRIMSVAVAALFILHFMVVYNSLIIDLREDYLEDHNRLANFLLTYLLIASLLAMLYQAYLTVKVIRNKKYMHIFQWAATFSLVYVLSASLDNIVALSAGQPNINMSDIISSSQRTGYTILWGAFAFMLIYLGFRWQSKQVRIIAISLFALTLLKLFLFDLHDLSEGGKIAAFISLGIILLIISFMYQRLKKILLTDENQTPL
ncbi:DUF2339 domain-containing protein [Chitinophaga ginsengisoli]|uniref:Putative membrane protein DUF2339 n=1 Tax=Chitinophaga ginsengisoli TaxID=363837 RepID=A0A2P8GD70_9BACT|nr:DUF2339 domain-containing protein [Chitinophaga ginsengisoli]PSL31902.1 putative membrane protein DUF2339 [Chitinophaga ginsengisoli]